MINDYACKVIQLYIYLSTKWVQSHVVVNVEFTLLVRTATELGLQSTVKNWH